MGPPQLMRLLIPSIQVEFVYSLVAAILLFIVFYKTKEFYDLTKHKGIYYFRNAFLYFAIAYVFRFISNFFLLSDVRPRGPSTRVFILIGYGLFTFVSSMGILSLAYSTVYKKIKKGFFSKEYSLYILAAVMLFLPILFNRPETVVFTQGIILIFAVIMSFINQTKVKRKKKTNWVHILYWLFLSSWILNVIAISLQVNYLYLKSIIFILSISCIVLIVVRVIIKTKKT